MQWYSLPMIMTDKCNSLPMIMTNAVIFFTNDNDRQMQWYSLPMIMTDKCSDILYQW